METWNYFGLSAEIVLIKLGIEPSPENVSRLKNAIPDPQHYEYGGFNYALGMRLERQFRDKVKELFL